MEPAADRSDGRCPPEKRRRVRHLSGLHPCSPHRPIEHMSAVTLTDEMRDYLRANARTDVLLFDFAVGFMKRFQLDPMTTGILIGLWLRETT